MRPVFCLKTEERFLVVSLLGTTVVEVFPA